MRQKATYTVLLVLTVLLLALPAVQQHTQWFKLKPLNGVTVATEKPKLNLKTFLSGEFQKQEDQYLAENIGFREWLIRCYNQMSWSLFRVPQNKSVYVGKDSWLFNEFMIRHHDRQFVYDYGSTNEEVVQRMEASCVMLYQLQELLKTYGVSMFVCLTPCKDRVCEEFLDKQGQYDRPSGVLAIDYLQPMFDSLGINYLNLSDYYMQIKDTVSYPLYLKSSFHWSLQSACYTADTLVRYMEHLSGINMHNLRFSKPYLAKTRIPDADLEDLLNLLWPIESDENWYVDVTPDEDTTAVKPKWLVVGDSYFWEWQYGLPMDQLFDSYHYWYYNSTIHNDPLHTNVNQVDVIQELLSTDVVMLIYSPNNLYDLNRGFLTNALFAFYFEEATVESMIGQIKQNIRNTPEWYASIEQKAAANGQTVEQELENNARYLLYGTPALYFEELKEPKVADCRNSRVEIVRAQVNDKERERYRKQMVANKEWLQSIREKAIANGITIDEAMEIDIDWMLNTPQQ